MKNKTIKTIVETLCITYFMFNALAGTTYIACQNELNNSNTINLVQKQINSEISKEKYQNNLKNASNKIKKSIFYYPFCYLNDVINK